jgi:hypothetical protein
VWMPAYARLYGMLNFVSLCDLGMILACVGVWRASPLLLGSQLVGAVVIDSAWTVDVAWRVVSGKHLLGGTEYMWDALLPLWLRLLSLFHVVLPTLLVLAVRRVGYDPRGLALQAAIAMAAIAAGRLAGPEANLNMAFRDPVLHRTWGPPAVHVATMVAGAVLGLYVPTHLFLSRWLPSTRRAA